MKSIYDERYRRVIGRLRQVRRDQGLRQADVAQTIGVARTFISGIETFERRADLLETHLIAQALGLSLSDLEACLSASSERNG